MAARARVVALINGMLAGLTVICRFAATLAMHPPLLSLLLFACEQVMFQAFGEGELTPVVQLEGVRASPLPAEALADAAKVKFELYIQ